MNAKSDELVNVDVGQKFAEITFKAGRTVGFFLSRVPYGEWRLWDASTRFCLDSDDLHAIVDKLDELNGVKE